MDTNLVIKVKYGATLRRFSVSVKGNGSVDVGMAGIETKIRNLFKFTSDDDITVTYIDEDQDVITLVDDDDLLDAIKQRLNPLRLNVQLKTNTDGTFDTISSGWSTPKSSQQGQGSLLSHANSGVAEVLKSLPKPLGNVVSKLSFDLASKAVSSSLVLTELLDGLAKLGQHPPVPVSESQVNDSDCSVVDKVTKGIETSKVSGPEVLHHTKSVEPAGRSNSKGYGSINKADGIGTSKPATTTGVDHPKSSDGFGQSTTNSVPLVFARRPRYVPVSCKSLEKEGEVHLNVKSSAAEPSAAATSESPSVGFSLVSPTPVPDDSSEKSVSLNRDNRGKHPSGSANSSPYKYGFCPPSNMPFSGMAGAGSFNITPPTAHIIKDSFRRGYSHCDSMGRIFHRGVQCDGCGVHPITGPRFKSKVREDYDLCSICFSEIGNEVEYTRMDRPMSYPEPHLYHQLPYSVFSQPAVPLTHKANVLGRGKKLSRPRNESLDCCFVQDVNIPDGYVIAPDTPFTKIWRMRNNGNLPWPLGTQLVWIGGNQFTTNCSVSEKNAANGCPVGHELDIAVQFVSPGTPGRYISYWRMKSPSGQEFGQRVWVLIQVDPTQADNVLHDSLFESINSLNLNLPPKCNDEQESSQIIDVNVEPLCADNPESMQSSRNAESVKPMVDKEMKDRELDCPIDNSLNCGNSVPISAEMPGLASYLANSVPISAEAPAFTSYPVIDSSFVPSSVVIADAPSVNEEANDSNTVEETLLKELEEMGFKQVDLNKEILRLNEYNLEQSVDDLCCVSKWDPILRELQEMGFSDKETNKRLLMKNGGSIKRVVMDLVAGERSAR